MADNLLVVDLQEINNDLSGASVRFRIFDELGDLSGTFISSKDAIVSGRFTAIFSGAAGIYFGHVEIRTPSGGGFLWQQTGQQIDTFVWDGTEFTYSAGGGATAPTEAEIYTYFTTGSREDAFKADVSGLSTFNPAVTSVTVGTNSDKTGYGLADGAIARDKIQDGAFTAAKFASGAFDAVWSVTTRTLTAIASIPDSTGISTLLGRITGLLPTKVEVDARTLPSADYATSTALATVDTVVDSIVVQTTRVDGLIENSSGNRFTTKALEQAPSGGGEGTAPTEAEIYTYFTAGSRADAFKATGFSTLTAAQVWTYSGGDRSLSGAQATNLAAIPNIPTNPLLTNDSRVTDIKSKTDQLTFIGGDIVSTLNGEEVVVSTAGINAIVAGVNGAITIPTAVQVRQEMDSNSTQLAAIRAIATGAKNAASAGL